VSHDLSVFCGATPTAEYVAYAIERIVHKLHKQDEAAYRAALATVLERISEPAYRSALNSVSEDRKTRCACPHGWTTQAVGTCGAQVMVAHASNADTDQPASALVAAITVPR
jgi:hypothetical protein